MEKKLLFRKKIFLVEKSETIKRVFSTIWWYKSVYFWTVTRLCFYCADECEACSCTVKGKKKSGFE